jgi:hypothetical protein
MAMRGMYAVASRTALEQLGGGWCCWRTAEQGGLVDAAAEIEAPNASCTPVMPVCLHCSLLLSECCCRDGGV